MHPSAGAERAAGYLVEHARRLSGVKYCQGAWDGDFALEAARLDATLPTSAASLKFLTRLRVRRVPQRALGGLFAWARGVSVDLRFDVPRADEVLALQAAGRRCVSLLPEGVCAAPHDDGFEFLIHDLCHLEKFVDPAHHEEQVGFFRTLLSLGTQDDFHELEEMLDATWREDRDRLAADVNGSAVYLFALLKMKLKMAARRRFARLADVPVKVSGPLDAGEGRVFDELERRLYECMRFDGELLRAARATSARRDDLDAASHIAAEFRLRGRGAAVASVLARAS
jgi:hypothetical protein